MIRKRFAAIGMAAILAVTSFSLGANPADAAVTYEAGGTSYGYATAAERAVCLRRSGGQTHPLSGYWPCIWGWAWER